MTATALAALNFEYPVGTPVRYWTGAKQGEGKVSKTRSEVQSVSKTQAVVWVEGHSGCISMTHIEKVVEVGITYPTESQRAFDKGFECALSCAKRFLEASRTAQEIVSELQRLHDYNAKGYPHQPVGDVSAWPVVV